MAPRLREYEVKKLLSLCLLYSRINTVCYRANGNEVFKHNRNVHA